MKKRLILVGQAASGKDYARKVCENWLGLTYQISYTTRPPRTDEIDGVDYHFLSESTFLQLIEENYWYEYVVFNGWYYGTSREQMESDNSVFIMTPKGMSHLSVEDREASLVVYFDIEEGLRKERMSRRGGNADSVERRIEADRVDFKNFVDYDAKIDNPYYCIGDLHVIIEQAMALPQKDKSLYAFEPTIQN